jgi:hypothetical protein
LFGALACSVVPWHDASARLTTREGALVRWLVIGAGGAVVLVTFLLGGLMMSSAANSVARADLLVGRLMWAVAAAVLALALYAAATRSPLALKALTGVVVAAGAALCLLVVLIWAKSQPRR